MLVCISTAPSAAIVIESRVYGFHDIAEIVACGECGARASSADARTCTKANCGLADRRFHERDMADA